MRRREFLGTSAAVGLTAVLPVSAQEIPIRRRGRIKQVHDQIEASIRPYIDMCAEDGEIRC